MIGVVQENDSKPLTENEEEPAPRLHKEQNKSKELSVSNISKSKANTSRGVGSAKEKTQYYNNLVYVPHHNP